MPSTSLAESHPLLQPWHYEDSKTSEISGADSWRNGMSIGLRSYSKCSFHCWTICMVEIKTPLHLLSRGCAWSHLWAKAQNSFRVRTSLDPPTGFFFSCPLQSPLLLWLSQGIPEQPRCSPWFAMQIPPVLIIQCTITWCVFWQEGVGRRRYLLEHLHHLPQES